MHQDAAEFFANDWPRLAARLRRWLLRRGVPDQDVDDLLQETAFRLLRAWPGLDTTRTVDTLAHTVALNIWRDRATAAVRREVAVDAMPETPSPEDVERTVIARTDLADVARRFLALPVTQQTAIRDAVNSESAQPRTAAVRMALMRARRTLASGISGVFVFVRTHRRGTAAGTASILAGGAVVLGLFAPWHSEPPAGPGTPALQPAQALVLRDAVEPHHGPAVVAVSRVPRDVTAPAAVPRATNPAPPRRPPPLPPLPPLPGPDVRYGSVIYFNKEYSGVHVRVASSDPDGPVCVEVNDEGPSALAC